MVQTANQAATSTESKGPIAQASFQSIIASPKMPVTDSPRQLESSVKVEITISGKVVDDSPGFTGSLRECLVYAMP
jgi:hypothetical protein